VAQPRRLTDSLYQDVSPRIRMAIARWQPANDGDSWARINGTWLILHTLIKEAARKDREERS
jgi:hypothetical protein